MTAVLTSGICRGAFISRKSLELRILHKRFLERRFRRFQGFRQFSEKELSLNFVAQMLRYLVLHNFNESFIFFQLPFRILRNFPLKTQILAFFSFFF